MNMKHLFYSLLITFLLLCAAEIFRPGFVLNFLNMNWLFLVLLIFGALMTLRLTKRQN